MPRTRGGGGAGAGGRRSIRRTVSPLSGIRRRVAIRAPASPPASPPRTRTVSVHRPGRWARTGASVGRRSAKVRRGHGGVVQRKRRPCTRRRTGCATTGRSRRRRVSRLGTRADGMCPSGQEDLDVLVRASMRSGGGAVETCATTKPGRGKGSRGVDIQEDILTQQAERFCISLKYTQLAIVWPHSTEPAEEPTVFLLPDQGRLPSLVSPIQPIFVVYNSFHRILLPLCSASMHARPHSA